MSKITLFSPTEMNGEVYRMYSNASRIRFEGSVLRFAVGEDTSSAARHEIRTTLPFLIEEDVDGMVGD